VVLVVAILLGVGSVWAAARVQRQSAEAPAQEADAATEMLDAVLDQNLAASAALEGDDAALPVYRAARRQFDLALQRAATRQDAGDEQERRFLRRQSRAVARWQAVVEEGLGRRGQRARERIVGGASGRLLVDPFLVANRAFRRFLDGERRDALRSAGNVIVAIIALLAAVLGGVGYALTARAGRRAAQERADKERVARAHEAFGRALQVTRNEGEAHSLVKRHIERLAQGARVSVLNRNNSSDRLEPVTALRENDPLGERLREAQPDSCLAVRMAGVHVRDGSDEDLLVCDVCGELPGRTTCVPSLVGGEVIGSVLLEHERPLSEAERERVVDSVGQASPVLANLRNLAVAELRAATDHLTGLPNARAINETLKRMVAHADRTLGPLAVVLLDLDHFKRINDTWGHEKGDEVLAAVGQALLGAARASDFAGRSGGEEFVVLLPETDRTGAIELAEKLRRGLHGIRIPGVEQRISASFGIAVYPGDAIDPAGLMRLADRGLYAAKAAGRDRVAHEPASKGAPVPA
jgi:diguanylate cyclase (GGDEF)-like protein